MILGPFVVGWRVNSPRPIKKYFRIIESVEIQIVTINVFWESSSYTRFKHKVKQSDGLRSPHFRLPSGTTTSLEL
jgi:hypothetical protein